jgi:hypothetical protein
MEAKVGVRGKRTGVGEVLKGVVASVVAEAVKLLVSFWLGEGSRV